MSPTRFTSPAARLRSRANHRPALSGAAVSAVALSLASLSGCGGSGVHAQTGTTTSPSLSSTPTTPAPSPTKAPSARQRAVDAAIAQVGRYEQVLNDLAIHPRLTLDRLYTVSTQPDVTNEISYLNHFREARDRQSGRIQLTASGAEHVNLTNHPHAHKPVYPTVTVTTCVNVSGIRAVDAQGKSIVPRSRKPYLLTRLTLVNFKYPDTSQWLVRTVTNTEERACDA